MSVDNQTGSSCPTSSAIFFSCERNTSIEHSEQCSPAVMVTPASNVAISQFEGNVETSQAQQDVGATLQRSASTMGLQYSNHQVSRAWQDNRTASTAQTADLFTFNEPAQDHAAGTGRWQETGLPLQEHEVAIPTFYDTSGQGDGRPYLRET